MSLSIGVMTIQYQNYPGDVAYRFMEALAENPNTGLDPNQVHADLWDGGGGWGNSYYEFEKEALLRRAAAYATQRQLNSAERKELLDYVKSMPYREACGSEFIMLHLAF